MVDNVEEADKAYVRAIEIDQFGQIGELAQKARSNIAKNTFRNVTPGTIRMDAVMYCLAALEKFASMGRDQVQKIGFEIAMLGTRGIDVNNPDSRYTLKSLPGQFSGLQLLSYQFVAFRQISPETNIGFDLAPEYQMALSLFENKTNKA